MSALITKLTEAQKYAMSIKPKVGGFPVLAQVLRQAGILMNRWYLPSCQSIYMMSEGSVVQQGPTLITGTHDVPKFNREALIIAIRTDQRGESTFPEFLQNAWNAGVVSYDADFVKRHVIYFGVNGESYLEEYPAVSLK
jgi:uncharacterized protein YbcV (DUF1398 family)